MNILQAICNPEKIRGYGFSDSMYLKSILLFCLFILSKPAFSQDPVTDSLKTELEKATHDTIRAAILNEISDNSYSDEDVLHYAEQALVLSRKSNYSKGEADALNNLGYVADNKGDYKKAMQYYQQSLTIRKAIGDRKGIAVSLNNIGNVYNSQGSYKEALSFQLESLAILEQTQDSFEIAVALHNIASLYRDAGNISLALEYHQKSLDIRKKIKDYDGISGALNNIAYIYGEQGRTDKAMEYYQQSLKIGETIGNKKNIAMAYNNMGYVIGDPEKSVDYYKKALILYEEIGNKEGIGYVLNNIGYVYAQQKNNERALEYYHKSLAIREELGSKDGIATNYINIGKVYEEQGDLAKAIDYYRRSLAIKEEAGQVQGMATAMTNIGNLLYRMKKYGEAEALCRKALILSQKLGYIVNIRNASLVLSRIYAEQNNYKKAWEMQVLFKEMSDSVNFSEARKSSAKKQMQFEFDKKEAQSQAEHEKREALSRKEIEKQKLVRYYTMAGFSLLLIGAGVFAYQYNQRKKSVFLQTVSEVEMKALRAQMNPHFIFNSLNSIKRYMQQMNTETAGEYLTKFARVMRMILENSQHRDVPLSEDLKALELYMQLEALRMDHAFTYEIIVDKEVDPEITLVPPLILQPFVENAIWHGFSGKKEPGKIRIHIRTEGDMLVCTVEDNGIGRKKSSEKTVESSEKKSLGMKITRSRLDILNKGRRAKGGIELVDLDVGLMVNVRLPLETDS